MKKNKTGLRKEVYDKYVAPVHAMDKQRIQNKRKDWWSKNLFNVIATLLTIAALLIAFISLLLQLK